MYLTKNRRYIFKNSENVIEYNRHLNKAGGVQRPKRCRYNKKNNQDEHTGPNNKT